MPAIANMVAYALTSESKEQIAKQDERIRSAHNAINRAQAAKVKIIRKAATIAGLCARKLADLKPSNGSYFVENKSAREPYRIAAAVGDLRPWYIREVAYLCEQPKFFSGQKTKIGCGWVAGKPRADDANRRSDEHRYFCTICGDLIAKERHTIRN